MGLSFGTDGVRGVAFEQLTVEFAAALGRAAAEVFRARHGDDVDVCLIGRDTRESGPALSRALASGFAAAGFGCRDLGVIPTPGVALGAKRDRCVGAMISASHNVWSDNGIKLFAPGGSKLDDEVQSAIQARLDELVEQGWTPTASGFSGVDGDLGSAADSYCDFVVDSVDGAALASMRLVLDCANGAASPVAERIFGRLGATVELMHATPDGRNINEGCGSTHPEALQARVVEVGADLGLAFDGDADRLIAVGDDGSLIDGDRIMGLMALDLRDRGALADDTLVVTVMSNLGLRRAMEAAGIALLETAVGDRYVLEALTAQGLSLGGEQSGHLIFADLATTGDGVLSGVLLADLVARAGRPSGELGGEVMTTFPQVLINVRVGQVPDDVAGALAPEITAVERELGDAGRVLVRASGTEPLVRVMVEASDADRAQSAAERLAGAVERQLG